MSRIGTTSSSRMCWTMCMTKACSPSRSMGEMSAAMRASMPAGEGEQAPDGRGARAVADADAAPARDVGHRRQADERQGTRVERPRSVRSHCAGLSQSCGRGVTRGAPASQGARHRPPSARRPRRRTRPTGVLGLRRDRGGGPAAVLGVPGRAALPAGRALPALRPAGPMRRALPGAGLGGGPGVGARRLRGPSASARARAQVPRRARGRRRHGGAGRRGRPAGPARASPSRSSRCPPIRCADGSRGFDHADRLATAIAALSGLAVVAAWRAGERRRARPDRRGRRAGRRADRHPRRAAIHPPAPCWSTMSTPRARRSRHALRRCDERGPTRCVRSPTHGR